MQRTSIPTGIGTARTEALVKLMNHIARSADRKSGSYPPELTRVRNLAGLPAADLDTVLQATEMREVWGIGRRITKL